MGRAFLQFRKYRSGCSRIGATSVVSKSSVCRPRHPTPRAFRRNPYQPHMQEVSIVQVPKRATVKTTNPIRPAFGGCCRFVSRIHRHYTATLELSLLPPRISFFFSIVLSSLLRGDSRVRQQSDDPMRIVVLEEGAVVTD